MAIELHMDEDRTTMICTLSGCHGCGSKGCGHIERFSEVFDIHRSTPITRLFLHVAFGRQNKIDEILHQFEDYYENEAMYATEDEEKDGLTFLKELILKNLQDDATWKICPTCDQQYRASIRKFQNIHYVIPGVDFCLDHTATP